MPSPLRSFRAPAPFWDMLYGEAEARGTNPSWLLRELVTAALSPSVTVPLPSVERGPAPPILSRLRR